MRSAFGFDIGEARSQYLLPIFQILLFITGLATASVRATHDEKFVRLFPRLIVTFEVIVDHYIPTDLVKLKH